MAAAGVYGGAAAAAGPNPAGAAHTNANLTAAQIAAAGANLYWDPDLVPPTLDRQVAVLEPLADGLFPTGSLDPPIAGGIVGVGWNFALSKISRSPWPVWRVTAPVPGAGFLAGIVPCNDRVLTQARNPAPATCASWSRIYRPVRTPAGHPGPPANAQRYICNVASPNLVPHPAGPGPHEVCLMCIDQHKMQPWYKYIERSLGDPITILPTPATLAAAPNQPIQEVHAAPGVQHERAWTKFLTPLCRSCEDMEKTILHERITGPWLLLAPPAVGHYTGPCGTWRAAGPNHDVWASYPVNTCTCYLWLAGQSIAPAAAAPAGPGAPLGTSPCIMHRYFRAGMRHNRLLITRQQNDNWLRKIARDRTLGTLKRAHPETIRSRVSNKIFRACRCGAEIEKDERPREVFLCMGCEGIVHYVAPLPRIPPAVPLPPAPPPGAYPAGLQPPRYLTKLRHRPTYPLRRIPV